MLSSRPELTVIMPVFNEAAGLKTAVEEVQTAVLDRVPRAELLVVDDGSSDTTPEILEQVSRQDPRIRILRQPNAGHGAALRRGLEIGTGEWLLLIDSDSEVSLGQFEKHWHEGKRREAAVIGIRRGRKAPWPRLLLTRAIRLTNRLLFGTQVLDANVPYKLLPRTEWQKARDFIPAGTLAPSLFLALFLDRNKSLIQRPVEHRVRGSGVSTLRWRRLLRFCAQALVQLLQFRWRLDSWRPRREY